jgi:chemotaxis protein methyltransferase CheR
LAQLHANVGKNSEAEAFCRQAIAINPLDPEPYYLLSHLEEERGNTKEAETLLQKVLYLRPEFVAAYLELAASHERNGDISQANRMRSLALEKLRDLPEEATVEHCEGIQAGPLALQIQALMDG